jgi:hypothetical protein
MHMAVFLLIGFAVAVILLMYTAHRLSVCQRVSMVLLLQNKSLIRENEELRMRLQGKEVEFCDKKFVPSDFTFTCPN